MGTPYASIVIPTHDRDTTLAWSVRSALAQSVPDFEVIIAGDGCTPAVRSVALELAREDRRVRFLDLPKAPLRGGANRDVAVRSAAASRVFYNDDDDLLLPHHVEVLGQALDDAEVVDTPVVSVCTEGRVAIGLHDSAHPVQRRLLAEGRFKAVFDTHLAHRKRTYTDRSGAWLSAPDHRAVLHMLKTFAASPDLTWTTLDRVTALSFHGARRVTMSPAAREEELRSWTGKIAGDAFESELRGAAGYCAHVYLLLDALAPEPDRDRIALLSALGIEHAAPPPNPPTAWERIGAACTAAVERAVPSGSRFTARQRAALDALLALSHGEQPTASGAELALDELLDPVLGPGYPGFWIMERFGSFFTPSALDAMLARLVPRPGVTVARFVAAIRQGRCDEQLTKRLWAEFDELPTESRFIFGVAIAELLTEHRDVEAAAAWLEAIDSLAPQSRHALGYMHCRLRLAVHLDDSEGAARARRRIAELERLVV